MFGAAVGMAAFGAFGATRGAPETSDVVRFALVGLWAFAGVMESRTGTARATRSSGPLGALVLIGASLGSVAFAAARLGETAHAALRHGARLVATLACPLLIALCAHVLLALPSGVLLTRARRVATVCGYVFAAVAGLTLWAGPGHLGVGIGTFGWIASVALTLPAAHRRYLSVAGVERQRLQWIGCGAALAGEIAVVDLAFRALLKWPSHSAAVAAAATGLIPLALAASTVPRLVARADRLLVHTVSVTGLTLVVVGVYLVIVVGLGRSPQGGDRQILALSMIAAAIAAIGYSPTRRRLNDIANRLVYGERQAPDEVLRTFGSRLTRAIPMDELLLQLAESLRKTMTLRCAEVWSGGSGALERVVSVPDSGPAALAVGERERPVITRAGVTGNTWLGVWLPSLLIGRAGGAVRAAPITHSGELLGLIVVERAPGADTFSDEDDRVLTELARSVGLALHNVQLDSALQETLDEVRRQAEELRASRARIVATADAERRKIERNLHDGAQQHLVALAVNLRLVKDVLGDDPAAAAAMLDDLGRDVKATIQEVRDLAHGIYPPLLLDSGLAEALRAAAGRSPLRVNVDAGGIGRYPPEVEAALYFCCLEALQNAAKHAPDARVEVRVWEDGGGVMFRVSDDGPGFGQQAATKGQGFVNMSDRLGAIGGSVRWESEPGAGAVVTGTVPGIATVL